MHIPTKQLEGRDHLVVPVVMLTVGVHSGSRGPVFYPAHELKNSASLWNGRPVVIYHPALYGDGSAGNPDVFNRQKVGVLFNTRFSDNSLKADAWIDIQRVQQVDRRIWMSIQQREMVEVSTGLSCHDTGTCGVFNGKPYHTVAQNMLPDHLAILPEGEGACSIAVGAGLVRNHSTADDLLMLPSMAF